MLLLLHNLLQFILLLPFLQLYWMVWATEKQIIYISCQEMHSNDLKLSLLFCLPAGFISQLHLLHNFYPFLIFLLFSLSKLTMNFRSIKQVLAISNMSSNFRLVKSVKMKIRGRRQQAEQTDSILKLRHSCSHLPRQDKFHNQQKQVSKKYKEKVSKGNLEVFGT